MVGDIFLIWDGLGVGLVGVGVGVGVWGAIAEKNSRTKKKRQKI